MLKDRYLNPFTDFGFKKIFGEAINQDLLIDFLNELLRDERKPIKHLTYLKNEQLASTDLDRRAIFDLYCESEAGEKFIVELQKSKQNFFKDRSIYYATFPIQEQAQRGNWNFELHAVYTIGILDFIFDEDKNDPDQVVYYVKLMDIAKNTIFYNKLTFIYLEMPKFKKTEEQLESHFDKWLYVLRNLSKLQQRPQRLQERVFEKLFKIAEIAQFTQEQRLQYEDSLKYYRDLKNSLETARSEGEAIGMQKGEAIGMQKGEAIGMQKGEAMGMQKSQLKIARALLDVVADDVLLAEKTGLSIDEIARLNFPEPCCHPGAAKHLCSSRCHGCQRADGGG